MNEDEKQNRITEINERIEWMRQNYHGCDWCCGGGDEEIQQLTEELAELQTPEIQTPA